MANTGGALCSDERWKRASELHALHEESSFNPLEVSGLISLVSNCLSRGTIAEVNGRRSSGRTSVCLHILAQATSRGEVCAVIDLYDSFHPVSAAAAGVRLDRLIWVRCHGNAEHAIRSADLLLHAGGFGVVLLDLCEANPRVLNRIPLSYWYRFRRAVEHTPAILLLCAEIPQAKSCSSHQLQLKHNVFHWSGKPPFLLLRGLQVQALLRKARLICPESLFIRTAA
jgi:hypothetical protein